MKHIILPIFLLITVYTISNCSTPTPDIPNVEDRDSLIDALQSTGATVEIGDQIIQDFFTPEGTLIKINGQDVQVFEYEDEEAMERDAAQVAPDGNSVGTSMMMWMDTPHFFKQNRILVLYIGSETKILTLLANLLGQQFAGR